MSKKKYILIGHKKRQGKDTFAKMLQDHLEDAEILSFADPMREILADMHGMSVDEYKKFYNEDYGERKRIQRFGSNKMIEYFGEHVWRDILIKKAEKSICDYIIVADFRFTREIMNEALTIKVHNLNVASSDQHESETQLTNFDFDIQVHNSEGLAELDKRAAEIAKQILNGELL